MTDPTDPTDPADPTDTPAWSVPFVPGTVAIVGRPNVGKSTLLNRILGRREAIVEEMPGVTRDRKVVQAEWCGVPFNLIDTGGWLANDDPLDRQVSLQAEKAVEEADVTLFVVDIQIGLTEEDDRVGQVLRRSGKRVVVVANKVDNAYREPEIWNLIRLGLGDPWPISAIHGRGTGDLLDEVIRHLPQPPPGFDADGEGAIESPSTRLPGEFAVAIVGRPNVGKSTLFNRMIGDDRAVVHDMPGTTRDAIDTVVDTPAGPVRFVDTAGMRHRAKTADGTEYFSMVRALQAIDAAESAILVIDASEGVTHQDQRLAERIDASGSPVVILLNKWELLDAEAREAARIEVADKLGFLGYAPVLKVSALTGLGVHKLLPALHDAIDAYRRRIPTRELNKVLASAQSAHAAPNAKILYGTQGATDPPTFTLFATRPIQAHYMRYLEKQIRQAFGFGPTPIKIRVRVRGQS